MMTTSDLYLDLLKRSILDLLHSPNPRVAHGLEWKRTEIGRSLTMIGTARLDNIQACMEDVLGNGVPGDVMETGVWRGGAAMFMKGVLTRVGDTERRVVLADSFQGLPPPDPDYPADAESTFHLADIGGLTSLADVKDAFSRYGLLDDRVVFLEGWFKDTLPICDVQQLALLRLDGDMYESTMTALENLYFKISPGGYLLIDDYPVIENCRQAVDDFRSRHGIREPLQTVPNSITGVYWKVNRDRTVGEP